MYKNVGAHDTQILAMMQREENLRDTQMQQAVVEQAQGGT